MLKKCRWEELSCVRIRHVAGNCTNGRGHTGPIQGEIVEEDHKRTRLFLYQIVKRTFHPELQRQHVENAVVGFPLETVRKSLRARELLSRRQLRVSQFSTQNTIGRSEDPCFKRSWETS